MPKGILYVESRPASPDREDEYNDWYTNIHLKDVVALDGIVSARRFAPLDDDGPYVAVYELELDDLSQVMKILGDAATSGRMPVSDAMQMDPPPTVRVLAFESELSG
jgi:hypothetical protein